MRTRAFENVIALFILAGALIFGFLPRSDLYPVKVDVYIQGDTPTYNAIEGEFEEGTRALEVIVDNKFSASVFSGDLLLTPGEHLLTFDYRYQGTLLDSKEITIEPSRTSAIRVDLNRSNILKVGVE